MTISDAPTAIVVGTGTMAPGIAAALASVPGTTVGVCGRRPDAVRAVVARAVELGAADVRAVGFEPAAFAAADVVIETVLEDADVKHEVLARVSALCPAGALLASNTSSLGISTLAASVRQPERFLGLHFLNPAEQTAVVEVAPGELTGDEATERAAALVRAMGKQPLVLRHEIEGFIWNRLQFAVLRECLHLLDTGVADAATIDTAISSGLAPRWLAAGPLATADLGGVRTFRLASEQLFGRLAASGEVSPRLVAHDTEGTTFYDWTPARRAAVLAVRADAIATGVTFDRRRAEVDHQQLD